MENKAVSNKKIGILATGSELISGEITNTNSPFIAQELIKNELTPGEHLTCDDFPDNLTNSMEFLLKQSQAIIITGGLGPTEDDRTRFIISKLINSKLEFDQNSFEHIKQRLQAKNIELKANNKQQCYFPKNSIIIPNQKGTAAGFITPAQYNSINKIIIALPGPPNENQPMLINTAIPFLIKNNFIYPQYKLRWCTENIPESNLDNALTPIKNKYNIEIAYRIHKPKCDIKINLPKQEFTFALMEEVKNAVNIILNNIT